ncbi:MAG TPA: CarD family transcriptional regulator, partial [Chiayiivirga sp.]|nr:CarD family transcriptional regulator [Chiayiivirga sp.]
MISPIPAPPLPRGSQKRIDWRVPSSLSALSLAAARTAAEHDGLLLAVTRDSHAARVLEAELAIFAPALSVLPFPDWETLPYDLFSPQPDIVSQRVATLYRLPSVSRGVLVVPVATLMQRLAPPGFIAGQSLVVEQGQKLSLDAEKRRLEAAGYRNVPQVLDPGDFAVRGALLDIFPMGSAEPYRIELFDEDVDSIRTFDPETQRSLHKVSSVRMLPAREFPLDEESSRRFRSALRERFPIDLRRCPIYQDMKEGGAPVGIEYYLPLFFDTTATLFDYLGVDTLCLLGEGALEAAETFWTQTGERHEQRRHDIERPILPPAEIFLSPESLREALNQRRRIEVLGREHSRFETALALGDAPAPALPLVHKGEASGTALAGFLETYPGRVLIAADSAGRREALIDTLGHLGMKPETAPDWSAFLSGSSRFSITVAALEDGFALADPPLCVLTERQFHPERAVGTRRRARAGRDPETILRDLSEISTGSPIVHEDHGVGRYVGLESLDVGEQRAEFLCIEYARGDKLYVPVAQLHLVNRYAGASPELAPLHSLGGEQWERAKKKAAEKVRDVAAELLEIQAKRQARAGIALQVDRSMYAPFAAQFPFEETPDQLAAIEA